MNDHAVDLSLPGDISFPRNGAIVNLGVSNDVEYALLSQLLYRLRTDAPEIRLSVSRIDPSQLAGRLTSGEITLGIGPTCDLTEVPDSFMLRNSGSVVLRADAMPGPLTLEEFGCRPHVTVCYATNVEALVNDSIKRLGYQREVLVEVSQFNTLPQVLARTDMLAVVPDYVASKLVKGGGLRSEPPPVSDLGFGLSMSWQQGSGNERADHWLRSRCRMMLGGGTR